MTFNLSRTSYTARVEAWENEVWEGDKVIPNIGCGLMAHVAHHRSSRPLGPVLKSELAVGGLAAGSVTVRRTRDVVVLTTMCSVKQISRLGVRTETWTRIQRR